MAPFQPDLSASKRFKLDLPPDRDDGLNSSLFSVLLNVQRLLISLSGTKLSPETILSFARSLSWAGRVDYGGDD